MACTSIPISGKVRLEVWTGWGLLAALLVATATASIAAAQGAAAPLQQPLRTTADLVKLDVSVLDRHGNFVGGLSQDQFRVLDGGLEQPIVAFAPVEAPAQVLVMVETSPAVYLIRNEHVTAAYALLEGLAPDDAVALVAYDQTPHALLNFTSDKSALQSALGKLQYTIGMGELNFYDSLSAVLDSLATMPGKRAVVLLTTGLDSSPPGRWDALIRKLRASDVVVFSVGLGRSLMHNPAAKSKSKKSGAQSQSGENGTSTSSRAVDEFARADRALSTLATMTGGRAYFPQSAKEFVPIYHEIASALRHQYILGITPARDGQIHSLTVQVLEKTGQPERRSGKAPQYRVLARQAYLAPAH